MPEPQSSPATRVALVAAVAANGVIGRDGRLPWHFPADLQYFKALTSGHRIVMGRNTWQSFPRPLPHREHVVITSQKLDVPDGVIVVASMQHALALPGASPTVFVIGGHRAYQEALTYATDVYLTEIDADVPGDTRFPDWDRSGFAVADSQSGQSDIQGIGSGIAYRFVHYHRQGASA